MTAKLAVIPLCFVCCPAPCLDNIRRRQQPHNGSSRTSSAESRVSATPSNLCGSMYVHIVMEGLTIKKEHSAYEACNGARAQSNTLDLGLPDQSC